MEFRVLGPVQVWHANAAVAFPRRQQRLIVGILAIEANRVMPVDRLIDLLWADRPPAHARAVVHTRVSEVRRILGSTSSSVTLTNMVGAQATGYVLQVKPDLVDAHRFRRLVQQAKTARSDTEARERLNAALGLWRGSALGGWLPRDSHAALCHALESERIRALEDLFDLELRHGRHGEVVDEIVAASAAHPTRERLIGQAMLALHRSARTVEALHAYDRYRRLIGEELGIDPGPELQDLHVGILRGDALATGRPVGTAPDPGPATTVRSPDGGEVPDGFRVAIPRILPGDIPDFTGRQKELHLLAELLTRPGEGVPVAVVAGPAGVGKTALCVHVSHRLRDQFGDGQLYVDLHGIDRTNPPEPDEVLGRFLRALGVESTLPDSLDERAELYRGLLAGRRVLIVLDNARDAGQLRPLLPGSSTCAVLINSRVRLAATVSGSPVDLDVLDESQAMALLARIAGEDRIKADPHGGARLVQLCGGLPLAIRIAAARLVAKPHWPLHHLADRLDDERKRLDQLAYGPMDVRASIALSYAGISADAQELLCRLGDLDLPEANVWTSAALLGTNPAQAEETLEHLHDAQLVDIAGREPGGYARYRLHDLVRLFAKERATAEQTPQALAQTRQRAYGAWLHLTDLAYSRVYGGDSENIRSPAPRYVVDEGLADVLTADPLAWFDTERQTITNLINRSAHDRQATTCWDLACTSFSLFEMRRYFEDCQGIFDTVLALTTETEDNLGRAAVLYRLGALSSDRDDEQRALSQYQEAADVFERVGDRHGHALATLRAATSYRQDGRNDLAMDLFHKALDGLKDSGDSGAEAFALRNIGQSHLATGNHAEADVYLQRALELSRSSRSRRREAQTVFWQGMLRLKQHRHRDAEPLFTEVLALTKALGDRPGQIQAQRGLGLCNEGQGNLARAQAMLTAALQLARQPTPTALEATLRQELARLPKLANPTETQ